jgi:hypothetical protein
MARVRIARQELAVEHEEQHVLVDEVVVGAPEAAHPVGGHRRVGVVVVSGHAEERHREARDDRVELGPLRGHLGRIARLALDQVPHAHHERGVDPLDRVDGCLEHAVAVSARAVAHDDEREVARVVGGREVRPRRGRRRLVDLDARGVACASDRAQRRECDSP